MCFMHVDVVDFGVRWFGRSCHEDEEFKRLAPVGRLDVVSVAMFLPHPDIDNELTCD